MRICEKLKRLLYKIKNSASEFRNIVSPQEKWEKKLVKMLDLSMIFRNRFVIFFSIGSAVSFVLIVKKKIILWKSVLPFFHNQKALDIEIP